MLRVLSVEPPPNSLFTTSPLSEVLDEPLVELDPLNEAVLPAFSVVNVVPTLRVTRAS